MFNEAVKEFLLVSAGTITLVLTVLVFHAISSMGLGCGEFRVPVGVMLSILVLLLKLIILTNCGEQLSAGKSDFR